MRRMLSGALFVSLTLALAVPGVAYTAPNGPRALARRMLARAKRIGVVRSVEVMRSSLGRAQATLDPQRVPGVYQAGRSAATRVDVVVMHGRFIDNTAPTPRGAASPTGRVMAFVLVRRSGEVVELYVGNRPVRVGTVVYKRRFSQSAAQRRRSRSRVMNAARTFSE